MKGLARGTKTLAERHPQDRAACTAGKQEFIEGILRKRIQ